MSMPEAGSLPLLLCLQKTFLSCGDCSQQLLEVKQLAVLNALVLAAPKNATLTERLIPGQPRHVLGSQDSLLTNK